MNTWVQTSVRPTQRGERGASALLTQCPLGRLAAAHGSRLRTGPSGVCPEGREEAKDGAPGCTGRGGGAVGDSGQTAPDRRKPGSRAVCREGAAGVGR